MRLDARDLARLGIALAGIDGSDLEPLKMQFGVHVADVAVHGDDLVGDGVNLTARIQRAAAPGAVWVSGVLFDHIRRNSPFAFDDLGERRFKKLSEPIRVYRVRGEMGAHRLQSAPTRSSSDRGKRPSSLAIMPFRVSSGDEDQRFFAEGLTEELIVELGHFRRLCVASRSASFALADSNPDPVRVGEALHVRYVLDGQVRKIGKNIRIGLTLSETEGGSVVWSDKITRPFEDLLALLDETVSKIAATVAGRMEDAGMVAARRRPPDNIEAFECLLRGIDHHRLGGVTDDNAREAVKWFSKAIEADPDYAAAYAWRVCAASWLPEFNLEEGERDFRRALELDACDPEANRILGFIELLKNNFDQAKSLSLKAMEMNPTDAYIKARSAAIMTYVGEPLRSLALLDEAEALDPLLPVWCIEERGVALYGLERYQEALEAPKGPSMSIKLTDTQLLMLSAAARRNDRCLVAAPNVKAAAAQKIAGKLITSGLVKEIKAKPGAPVWRRDDEAGQSYALKLTALGAKAIAIDESAEPVHVGDEGDSRNDVEQTASSSQQPSAPDPSSEGANATAPARPSAPRGGTKLAEVVELLQRDRGTTIDELIDATGWLPHTTRAALTGLRKRGFALAIDRSDKHSARARGRSSPWPARPPPRAAAAARTVHRGRDMTAARLRPRRGPPPPTGREWPGLGQAAARPQRPLWFWLGGRTP